MRFRLIHPSRPLSEHSAWIERRACRHPGNLVHFLPLALPPWLSSQNTLSCEYMLLLSCSLPRQPCALPTLARRARPLSAAAVRDAGCERRLLRGVLAEALEKQRRKRFALTEQSGALERSQLPSEAKARAKAVARAEALPLLLRECDAAEAALSDLHARLYERRPDLPALRRAMEELGLEQRLELYDVDRAAMDQWGRPAG